MNKIFFYSTIFIFLLFSCKNETSTIAAPGEITPEQVPQAIENVPDHIAPGVLIGSDWEIEIVMDNGTVTDFNGWKGSILKFSEDGNYTWTKGEFLNKGTFVLDSENSSIVLNSSDPALSSEWTIKYKRSVMIWIGTAKFGYSAVQMKLNKKI